ncbi:hypothetical protein [Paenibacillus sp. HB172176]|uniref:hypothetical protein n=1 Tax=Paenibacillus sp. HB172176 TaxID=2493690 RepID=UPI001438B759|nr:hypothetical protein [Paenibacillus sp. HB172176]
MRWIPKAKSSKWWLIAVLSALLTAVSLCGIRFGLLQHEFDGGIAFRFLILSLVLSFLFSMGGWLGGKLFWICSSAGLLLALIMMGVYADDSSGWEDLISILVFMELTAAGIAAGIVAELIRLLARKLGRHQ